MRVSLIKKTDKPILVPKHGLKKMAMDVALKLQHLNVDPITIIALFAVGDVISLGFMTKEEYRADAEVRVINGLKVVVAQSGKQRGLQHIPPKLRLDAAQCLAEYVYPKRAAVTHMNPDGSNLGAGVTLLLPDNGRVPLPTTTQEKRA
jgi:hypothetical protein